MCKTMIFVEGKSDKEFLKAYLEYLGIERYEIIVSGGKDNLINILGGHIEQAMGMKQNILIIFDRDTNYKQSLDNIEKQLSFYQDLQYKIFLLPNNQEDSQSGDLETLLKEIVAHPKLFDCFDCYCDCVRNYNKDMGDFFVKRTDYLKTKLYAYGQHCLTDPKQLQKSLWDSGLFDFEHDALKPLKNFLENTPN